MVFPKHLGVEVAEAQGDDHGVIETVQRFKKTFDKLADQADQKLQEKHEHEFRKLTNESISENL